MDKGRSFSVKVKNVACSFKKLLTIYAKAFWIRFATPLKDDALEIYRDKFVIVNVTTITVQKTKFSIKHFFSKCDQQNKENGDIYRRNSLMESFIFCAVNYKSSAHRISPISTLIIIAATCTSTCSTVLKQWIVG